MMIDKKLTYREHIKKAADKAALVTTTLSRLMGNIGGPKASKRRLLMAVMRSVILYAAEIWADLFKNKNI